MLWKIAPLSGLTVKHLIDIGAGVIGEDYVGNTGVVLFNFGKEKFEIKKDDLISQLICEEIFYSEIDEVQVLDDTERDSGGFGCTGNNYNLCQECKTRKCTFFLKIKSFCLVLHCFASHL